MTTFVIVDGKFFDNKILISFNFYIWQIFYIIHEKLWKMLLIWIKKKVFQEISYKLLDNTYLKNIRDFRTETDTGKLE